MKRKPVKRKKVARRAVLAPEHGRSVPKVSAPDLPGSGVAPYGGPVRVVLDNTVPGGFRMEPAL